MVGGSSISLLPASPRSFFFVPFCFILKREKNVLFCSLLSRKAPFFPPVAGLHLLSSKNSFSFATSTAEAHFVFHLCLMHNAGGGMVVRGVKMRCRCMKNGTICAKGAIVFEGEAIFFIKNADTFEMTHPATSSASYNAD